MANQAILSPGRALDADAYAASGATATFYLSGTDTLAQVFSDAAGSVVAENPVVSDASGLFPQRYVAADTKAVVADADGVVLYTLDPVPVVQSSGASAASVSFAASVDIPRDNVQEAIEYVLDAFTAPDSFAAYGLGITGNATLLNNINATDMSAGVYRFGGATTGTFPGSVLAEDTGLVEVWRQSSAIAMMMLYHATSDRVFHRRMAGGAWEAWREVITAPHGAVEGDILYRAASAWARLAKGTAGQSLRINSGATAPEWSNGEKFTALAEVSTASGSTAVEFAVPSTAKEITVHFIGVVLAATGRNFRVRLGTASSVEATGYTQESNGNTDSTSFVVNSAASNFSNYGAMRIAAVGSNKFIADHNVGANSGAAVGGGSKTLSAALTRIQITPSTGNWNGGAIAVTYRE